MDAIFGMLLFFLTLLRQWMGLLPWELQTAGPCPKSRLAPQLAFLLPLSRQLWAGLFGEPSPERSWFRLLTQGWPASPLASLCTSLAARKAQLHPQ